MTVVACVITHVITVILFNNKYAYLVLVACNYLYLTVFTQIKTQF